MVLSPGLRVVLTLGVPDTCTERVSVPDGPDVRAAAGAGLRGVVRPDKGRGGCARPKGRTLTDLPLGGVSISARDGTGLGVTGTRGTMD